MLAAAAATSLWVSLFAGPWGLGAGLLDSARHLERAQNKLTAGALKDARFETLSAVAAAERAAGAHAQGAPLLDVARLVPAADAVLDQAPHFIAAARASAAAAEGTLEIAQTALRGKNRIIQSDPEDPKAASRIRIERIREVADTVDDIRADVRRAGRALRAVDLDDIPRRFRHRVSDGLAQAEESDRLLGQAQRGLAILPGFLGAEGPRTYLIGMQNTAEQRGTGGAMLQFAVLTMDRGDPQLQKGASTVYQVDRYRQPISIPLPQDAWYVAGIADAQRFGNANWSPDWPLSAQLTIRYGEATPQVDFPDVDGVIGVSPLTMEDLIPGTGPYTTRKSRNRISERKVVHFLLHKAYAMFPSPRHRRKVLRQVVDGFYERLLDPAHPAELVKGLGEGLRRKHMLVWLADPREQRFVEAMDWDGAIRAAKNSDYLYVVQQNVGGNKLDYFATQSNRVEIDLRGRDAHHSTTIRIGNRVVLPQPRWALGNSGPLHRPFVNLYVHGNATNIRGSVRGTLLEGAAEGLAAWNGNTPALHRELGKTVMSAVLEIAPQKSGSVRFDYVVPGVVRRQGNRTTYRLVLQHQPKVTPERMNILLRLPPGVRDVRAPGWRKSAPSRLEWDRPLEEDTVLEISWRS